MKEIVWMVLTLTLNPTAEASNPRPDRLFHATLVTVVNCLYSIKCCTVISVLRYTNYCEFYTAAPEPTLSTGCGFWHLYVLGLLYRMTLRTEPSDRDVRTRSAVSLNVDLGTRYVTVRVVSLVAGRSGGKRDNDNKRYTMRRMVL
jgi:hypothetical protein